MVWLFLISTNFDCLEFGSYLGCLLLLLLLNRCSEWVGDSSLSTTHRSDLNFFFLGGHLSHELHVLGTPRLNVFFCLSPEFHLPTCMRSSFVIRSTVFLHSILFKVLCGSLVTTEFHLLDLLQLPLVHFQRSIYRVSLFKLEDLPNEWNMDTHVSMFSSALVTDEDADVRWCPFGVLLFAVKTDLLHNKLEYWLSTYFVLRQGHKFS